MQVLIIINEKLIFHTILELVVCRKLNRIYYFNVQLNKKGKEIKNTECHNIFLFCLYLV